MRRTMISTAALVLAAGCLDKPTRPPDPVVGAIGTVTLSGSMSATFATNPITATCLSATNCDIIIAAAASPPFFTAHVGLSAQPTVRTYSATDPDKSASATASNGSGSSSPTWSAGIFPNGPDRGTFSLVLTEVGARGAAAYEFPIHGTFDATLIGEPPTTGTVTVHVVF